MKIANLLENFNTRYDRIINESETTDISRIFDLSENAQVEVTSNGINVQGSVYAPLTGEFTQPGVSKPRNYTKIPVKFNEVTRDFNMTTFRMLNSMENFPVKCKTMDVSGTRMSNFQGGENIVVSIDFSANNMPKLVSLEGCPSAAFYEFLSCKNLTSLVGLPVDRLVYINLSGSDNISNLGKLLNAGPEARILITYNPNIPLIKYILTAGRPDRPQIEMKNTGGRKHGPKFRALDDIIDEYRGQGLGKALLLQDELERNGFSGNAKL